MRWMIGLIYWAALWPALTLTVPSLANGGVKVLIDTDMAIDDWPAMMYLLNQDPAKVEVLGVTVTGAGEAHCDPGAQHAVDLVDLTPQRGLPVACGDAEPMDGYHEFPTAWRQDVDRLYGVPLPASPRRPEGVHAVDLLIRLLQASPTPVRVVILGNGTNVATALRRAPEIKAKIERLVIMAGSIWAGGNIIVKGFTDHHPNRTAEWNAYVDPVATRMLLQSGLPVTLVPLDATNQVRVTRDDVAAFKKSWTNADGQFYAKVLDATGWFIDSGEYYFWDVLTAVVAVHPALCDYERLSIDVVVGYSGFNVHGDSYQRFSPTRWDGQPRRALDAMFAGQTLISDQGAPVDVCVKAKVQDFRREFYGPRHSG